MRAPAPSPVADVLALQASAGNHAVAAMLLRQPTQTIDPAVVKRSQQAEEVWTALLGLSDRATAGLASVGGRIQGYLDRYDKAYGGFSGALTKAQAQAAEAQKWDDVLRGIVIGVGVGLASGGLYNAATLLGKVAYEAAGEGIEAIVGQATQPAPKVDFTPPPDLNNDKVARGQLQQLLQAWQALALVQAGGFKFSPVRDKLRDAANGHGAGPANAAQVETKVAELRRAVDAAERALQTFLVTADTPVLGRDEKTIEQDLWIRWMALSGGNAGEMLQDDAAGDRMKQLGVAGRLVPDRTVFAGEQIQGFAQAEQGRMERIGRMGVVIVPPRQASGRGRERNGVVRLRHDATAGSGRADPAAGGGEEYLQIGWERGRYLRPGEAVMVRATTSSGVTVDRAAGADLPVADSERRAAFGMLGIQPGEYVPEAADALFGVVWGAIDWRSPDEGKLKLVKSEDGVLVTEDDGRKVILFGPLTELDWIDAEFRRQRVGAPWMVAINLEPGRQVNEDSIAMTTVTARSDAAFLAGQIRNARSRLHGAGPAAPAKAP